MPIQVPSHVSNSAQAGFSASNAGSGGAQLSQDSELATFDADSIVTEAKDLNVLAALAIPKVMAFLFPPMYLYFWRRCTQLASGERGFPKFALGIPRGHAKSTFIKLLILFIILFTRRKFILIIAASEGLAEAILSDVIDTLDSNNMRSLFGHWDANVRYNRSLAKSFHFRGRDIILKAKGQGSSFRGVAEKFARPDVMIFDDAQTDECAASPEQAMKFIHWFRGTAMKAKDPKFCFYLYVGNMYRKLIIKKKDSKGPAIYGCQLRNLKESSQWESLIVGAILQDGTALWEDLQSLAQLLDEYLADSDAGSEEVFLAEVQNDDEAYNSGMFDPSKVPLYPYHLDTIPQGRCIIIDPSLGKTTSDNQRVTLVDYIDGRACVIESRIMQVSSPQLVRAVIDWALESQTPCIAVESYAYQASLCDWFQHYFDQEGIEGLSVVEISRGQRSKVSAILSSFKMVMDGETLLGPRVRADYFDEAKNFKPLDKDNVDDLLDTVAYAAVVHLQYPQEVSTYLHTLHHLQQGRASGGVVDKGLTWGGR